MRHALTFTAFGRPMTAGSKIAGQTKDGRLFVRDDNRKTLPWKQSVSQAAGIARGAKGLLEGPVRVWAVFVVTRPKHHYGAGGRLKDSSPLFPTAGRVGDVDKMARALLDGMTGIVYRDDVQVTDLDVARRYGSPERVEVQVFELEKGDEITTDEREAA